MKKLEDAEKPRRVLSDITNRSWPEFPSASDDNRVPELVSHLPRKGSACEMVEVYLEHAKWRSVSELPVPWAVLNHHLIRGTVVTREEAYDHLIRMSPLGFILLALLISEYWNNQILYIVTSKPAASDVHTVSV